MKLLKNFLNDLLYSSVSRISDTSRENARYRALSFAKQIVLMVSSEIETFFVGYRGKRPKNFPENAQQYHGLAKEMTKLYMSSSVGYMYQGNKKKVNFDYAKLYDYSLGSCEYFISNICRRLKRYHLNDIQISPSVVRDDAFHTSDSYVRYFLPNLFGNHPSCNKQWTQNIYCFCTSISMLNRKNLNRLLKEYHDHFDVLYEEVINIVITELDQDIEKKYNQYFVSDKGFYSFTKYIFTHVERLNLILHHFVEKCLDDFKHHLIENLKIIYFLNGYELKFENGYVEGIYDIEPYKYPEYNIIMENTFQKLLEEKGNPFIILKHKIGKININDTNKEFKKSYNKWKLMNKKLTK